MTLRNHRWFDTLTVAVPDKAAVLARALGFGINLRGDLDGAVGISFDECSTRDDLEALFTILLGDGHALDIDTLDTLARRPARAIFRRRYCAAGRS